LAGLSSPLVIPDVLPKEALEHYEAGVEHERLARGPGSVERERTQAIILRDLPAPPAVILDVGGGPGVYATWLAAKGFDVHLIDAVPLHVQQALEVSARQPPFALKSAVVGDARSTRWPDKSVDAVLLLGPLYHLTERHERVMALREARRVLRSGGVLFAAAVSRYASVLDGLWRHLTDDPVFRKIVERDLEDGQHRNPSGNPDYFTTTYFHRPEDLEAELKEAELQVQRVCAVEGPSWLLPSLEADLQVPERRDRLFEYLRKIESEPSLRGVSAHLLGVARA
jgi:ubiquinone/menaquinone biosynthesis C-methylase UbiE